MVKILYFLLIQNANLNLVSLNLNLAKKKPQI